MHVASFLNKGHSLRASGLWRHQGGAAALELALLMPLLSVLMLGCIDLAQIARQSMKLQALLDIAAVAAAQRTAVAAPRVGQIMPPIPPIRMEELAPLAPDMQAQSRAFWACTESGALTATQAALCSNSQSALPYAELALSQPTKRIVSWPAAMLPDKVEARLTVRLG